MKTIDEIEKYQEWYDKLEPKEKQIEFYMNVFARYDYASVTQKSKELLELKEKWQLRAIREISRSNGG